MSHGTSIKKNFNPRSLTGATYLGQAFLVYQPISILAPSRERPFVQRAAVLLHSISILAPSRERPRVLLPGWRDYQFQSSLPHGSDFSFCELSLRVWISILAPSRERPLLWRNSYIQAQFQSSLPHGSDRSSRQPIH